MATYKEAIDAMNAYIDNSCGQKYKGRKYEKDEEEITKKLDISNLNYQDGKYNLIEYYHTLFRFLHFMLSNRKKYDRKSIFIEKFNDYIENTRVFVLSQMLKEQVGLSIWKKLTPKLSEMYKKTKFGFISTLNELLSLCKGLDTFMNDPTRGGCAMNVLYLLNETLETAFHAGLVESNEELKNCTNEALKDAKAPISTTDRICVKALKANIKAFDTLTKLCEDLRSGSVPSTNKKFSLIAQLNTMEKKINKFKQELSKKR